MFFTFYLNFITFLNGEIEPKITMLLRISEALNISLSELIKDVERELGNDFHVIEQ